MVLSHANGGLRARKRRGTGRFVVGLTILDPSLGCAADLVGVEFGLFVESRAA